MGHVHIVDYDEAIGLFKAGHSLQDLAKRYGVIVASLQQGFKRHGFNGYYEHGVIKSLDVPTIAYLAGLLDGEGTINISLAHQKHFFLTVAITGINRALMDWFKDTVGGYIRTANRAKIGHQTCYSWTLCSIQAANFLKLLLPYLRLKKKQAELAIEFQDSMHLGQPLSDERHAKRLAYKKAIEAMHNT